MSFCVEEFPWQIEYIKIDSEGNVLPKSNTPKTIRMKSWEGQHGGGKLVMENNERNDVLLRTVATILLRSFLFGLAFLLLWFFLYLIALGWMFEINARWFNIDRRDFELINYFGIGFLKICILLFFLLPYLAIRSMLQKKGRKRST